MRGVTLLFTWALAAALGGCSSLGYYWQSASGHLSMLRAARPVQDWLDDPHTPAELRSRLQSAQRLRDFAVQALHLPDNPSYRRYADLGRPAVVWNVVAAPELSLQLKTWCFPVLGCVGYRGYFQEAQAQAMAKQLQEQGWEVSVYGVPAYSTLGKLPGAWLADPLLNTFIGWPEVELGRLMFHELAHQVAYAADDTSFNESFATAVERLGAQQWLRTQADAPARARYAQVEQRRAAFRTLVSGYRAQLEALYRSEATPVDKRAGKARLMAQMRADYAQLKASWQGWAGYDDWFARANNATLAVQSAYDSRVDDFERWFLRCEEDYVCLYREARRMAALPAAQRQAALAAP